MSQTYSSDKFLFIWDCDSKGIIDNLIETTNHKKFCFNENRLNTKSRDKYHKAEGIENLYPDELFTEDMYKERPERGSYGVINKLQSFDKKKFLEKIKREDTPEIFKNFQPLIDKIKELVDSS